MAGLHKICSWNVMVNIVQSEQTDDGQFIIWGLAQQFDMVWVQRYMRFNLHLLMSMSSSHAEKPITSTTPGSAFAWRLPARSDAMTSHPI